nr:uncharacterized mitochondrial protein AtMg00810-like [Tanacetum cinerariifolium]
FVKSLNKKRYFLVITDDYSRFTWVFFLATEDETSPILKTFITGLENQLSLKVKAEAVNTACYVQNRVLVTKPHNKTLYELLHGRTPSIGFMRPFGCLVTILNTLDPLGKFERKVDEGFLVGYSVNSKAFRVFNNRTRIVQETLHNKDGDAAFDGKEHEVDTKKHESAVNVSLSSSAQSGKQDDKTKKKAKGKSSIESFTGNRDLSAEFEDYSDNNSNDVNAAGSIVPTAGQNSSNSTNPFSVTGPSNTIASPTHGKSSFKDASQLPDNLDMLEMESAFPYGTIEEEVYVCQPLGFEDPDYLDKFYKVVKALYVLHQAPRAWYETLANYLLENGFHRGKIDQTLFIKKQKRDILLVHIYVDDIIFGATNKDLCKSFEKMIKDKFQMSLIGELTFFLGLQMFGLTKGKSASTPIDTEKPLLKDPDGAVVDVHIYRSIIGFLMYLTSSRPDIMFAVCACAHFQVTPKASHIHAVKRIFRYLKGKPYLGLWYPKDSPFDLVAYSDSDYAGEGLDRKSTTGGCQFLGCRLISWQCKKQTVVATSSTKAEYVAAASCCAQMLWIQNQLMDYGD